MYKQLTVAIMAAVMVVSGCVLLASDDSEAVSAGGNTHSTITDAIAVAPTDGTSFTISLTEDVTESITISTGKNIVLDLGTYKLTNTDGNHTITVQSGATLTVQGSGTVDNVSHKCACIQNDLGGTVVLNGGTFERSKENGINSENSGGNSFYCIRSYGQMTINDGVSVIQNGQFSSMIENGYYNGNENTSGTDAVMVINGGSFVGGLNTIKNDDYGVITINGGTFSNIAQSAVLNWNVATINGGTFSGEASNIGVILNGFLDNTMDKGELTINGGTFNGAISLQVMGGSTSMGVIKITGGTFNATSQVIDPNTSVNPDISITGGSFKTNVSTYVETGYKQVGETVGKVEQTMDPSTPVVDVSSDSGTVVVDVTDTISGATVDATVTPAGSSQVQMSYSGDLTTDGIAMSATVIAPEDKPEVVAGNPLTVYDLVVDRGTTIDTGYTLTVTVTLDIPAGMTLSGAYVMFYEEGKTPERYTPEVDGATVTFTTTHNTYYAVYGDVVEAGSGSQPSWDDDEDLPPFIPTQPAEDDDTVTIVACAAAAAVAAILAVFLVIDRKG